MHGSPGLEAFEGDPSQSGKAEGRDHSARVAATRVDREGVVTCAPIQSQESGRECRSAHAVGTSRRVDGDPRRPRQRPVDLDPVAIAGPRDRDALRVAERHAETPARAVPADEHGVAPSAAKGCDGAGGRHRCIPVVRGRGLQVRPEGVGARPAAHDVGASAQVPPDPVVAAPSRHPVAARATDEQVCTGATGDPVGPGFVDEDVGAGSARDPVGSPPSAHEVAAATAAHQVVAGAPEQVVAARSAAHGVVAASAVDPCRERGSAEVDRLGRRPGVERDGLDAGERDRGPRPGRDAQSARGGDEPARHPVARVGRASPGRRSPTTQGSPLRRRIRSSGDRGGAGCRPRRPSVRRCRSVRGSRPRARGRCREPAHRVSRSTRGRP